MTKRAGCEDDATEIQAGPFSYLVGEEGGVAAGPGVFERGSFAYYCWSCLTRPHPAFDPIATILSRLFTRMWYRQWVFIRRRECRLVDLKTW